MDELEKQNINDAYEDLQRERDVARANLLLEEEKVAILEGRLKLLDNHYNHMAAKASANWHGLNRERERAEKAESQLTARSAELTAMALVLKEAFEILTGYNRCAQDMHISSSKAIVCGGCWVCRMIKLLSPSPNHKKVVAEHDDKWMAIFREFLDCVNGSKKHSHDEPYCGDGVCYWINIKAGEIVNSQASKKSGE